MSVAVLSLCAIMASRALRAWVVPVRLRKTGLLSERTASSTFTCWSSVRRPASTSRRYCARMKVLTALPTNMRAAGSCAARHGALGWSTTTRQLAVAGMRAKRSTAACTSAAPSAATARLIKTGPASAEAPSANMRRRSRFMAIPLLVTASVSAATDSITAVGDVRLGSGRDTSAARRRPGSRARRWIRSPPASCRPGPPAAADRDTCRGREASRSPAHRPDRAETPATAPR